MMSFPSGDGFLFLPQTEDPEPYDGLFVADYLSGFLTWVYFKIVGGATRHG